MALTELSADVLVVGGGMAGMSVAARAAQLGAEVVVVEATGQVGGSAALSEGFIWTAPDEEAFRREDPTGNVDQFIVMRSEMDRALGWVADLGVELGPPLTGVLGFGIGHRIEIAHLLDKTQSIVEDAAGQILCNTTPEQLIQSGGRVTGARLHRLDSGSELVVRAGTTVLATGGFQANRSMLDRYIYPGARHLLLRSNAASNGAGLRLGREVGAALTERMDGFYGHLVPSPLEEWAPSEYTLLTQYHSEHGVLLDHGGKRFCDESLGDHVNALEVAHRGVAILLIDAHIREERVLQAFIPGMAEVDKMREGQIRGGLYATAETLDDVAAAASEWEYDARQISRTVREFNRMVTEAPERLDPPRRRNTTGLLHPPFFLLQVQAAITFTYGGLSTDLDGRVLDRDATPIGGLYAAGVDAGGLNVRGYTGGLIRGLALGRKLGETVAGR